MNFRTAIQLLVFLIAIAIFGPSVPAQATHPDAPAASISELKDDARKQIDMQWRNIPALGERDARDVVEIKMVDDCLVVTSALPQSQGSSTIKILGYPGQSMYRLTKLPTSPAIFLFLERYDFSDPAVIDVHEIVLSSPRGVGIVQDIEYPQLTQTISLDEVSRQGDDPGGIVLRIQTVSEADGSNLVNLKFEAANLAILRREHPAEVNQYLRPILRSLGQESAVLGVDLPFAWQIVSDTWQPPLGLDKKVTAILSELNSDNYSVRSTAQKKLSGLGEVGALYLMSINRTGFSDEQNARVDQFLHPYKPATPAQVQALRSSPDFLLDCLDCADVDLRAAVLAHIKIAGKSIAFDMKLTGPERQAQIAKLRRQLIPPPATAPSPEK